MTSTADATQDRGTSSILDPFIEVTKLREQFAQHDRPIAFLIGAGASASVVGNDKQTLIPAVQKMTELVLSAVGTQDPKFTTGLTEIQSQILLSPRPTFASPVVNIEEILTAVRLKIEAMAETDVLQNLSRADFKAVEKIIQRTIADIASPSIERIPLVYPHQSLARWIGRIERTCAIEIFTTNYDTLIERALEEARIAIFDGFVGSREPFFSSNSLVYEAAAPAKSWTRLWKVHGSINWELRKNQVVRVQEGTEGELILPSSRKYDESRKQPYVAMLDRLGSLLTKREDTLLVTIGYSFGDQHINEVLFESMGVLERMHIISLQFEDLDPEHELMKRATNYRNLVVYGPTQGVVGGQLRKWRLIDPVDQRTAELLDIPFDSDFEPGDAVDALNGRFRLGDFTYFARFLDQITGSE